jgi:hypothetical protein
VPPAAAKRFEALAAALHPQDANDCAEFLRHKRYLFSPSVLREAGIETDTVRGRNKREREKSDGPTALLVNAAAALPLPQPPTPQRAPKGVGLHTCPYAERLVL